MRKSIEVAGLPKLDHHGEYDTTINCDDGLG
jgi:hypothetical protein